MSPTSCPASVKRATWRPLACARACSVASRHGGRSATAAAAGRATWRIASPLNRVRSQRLSGGGVRKRRAVTQQQQTRRARLRRLRRRVRLSARNANLRACEACEGARRAPTAWQRCSARSGIVLRCTAAAACTAAARRRRVRMPCTRVAVAEAAASRTQQLCARLGMVQASERAGRECGIRPSVAEAPRGSETWDDALRLASAQRQLVLLLGMCHALQRKYSRGAWYQS